MPNGRREYTYLLKRCGCLFINRPLYLNFFNCPLRYLSHSSLLPHWISQYVLSVPPTHTIAARSKSQIDMHCQVELGQYYNSRPVGEGLCVVIHFKSWECSYRWRSLWMKCLLCPSLFTETWGTWRSDLTQKSALGHWLWLTTAHRCHSIWYSKVWIQLKGRQLKALKPFLCQTLRYCVDSRKYPVTSSANMTNFLQT